MAEHKKQRKIYLGTSSFTCYIILHKYIYTLSLNNIDTNATKRLFKRKRATG